MEVKRRETIEKLAPSIGSKIKGARFVRVSRARPQMAGTEQLQLRYKNLCRERERERVCVYM